MKSVIKNQLAEFGYNLVALPKEGISPLLLLYKNKRDVSSAGIDMQQLFGVGNFPPPAIESNIPLANLDLKSEITFNAEAGISVLDWLLQKLKMGKLAGEFSTNHLKSVSIRYNNILQDEIKLGELDNYLTSSKPQLDNFTTFRKRLEKSKLYVINSILKSNSFSVSAINKNNQQADIEATIRGVVDADVKVDRGGENSVNLKHESSKPIVFAFKAQRIIYDEKKWWEFFKKNDLKIEFRIKDEQKVVLKDDGSFPTQPLQLEKEIVDL